VRTPSPPAVELTTWAEGLPALRSSAVREPGLAISVGLICNKKSTGRLPWISSLRGSKLKGDYLDVNTAKWSIRRDNYYFSV